LYWQRKNFPKNLRFSLFLAALQVEDNILWRSFTSGDRPSFEAIYRQHFDMLYEYGLRRTKDEGLTRDTIHDLFVKLWTNRTNLRETDNIKYYLLASFKNSLLNAQASKGRQKEYPTANPEEFLLQFTQTMANPAEESGQQQARLLEALDQLRPRQKEIIWLRYFEEMDYDQIAVLLDISVGGVYKLHYRALDALKDILNLSQGDLLLLLLLLARKYVTN
jgi:RNA polymerase sigma factor (sigma-70 family)